MKKTTVIASLKRNLKWVTQQLDKSASQDGGWRAQDIMVGCAQVIMECDGSFRGWMDRRPERRGQLQRVQESYVKRRGNKVLRDLIELAISEAEACFWRPHFSVGALPVSSSSDRPVSDAQREALRRARAKQKRDREALQNRVLQKRRPEVPRSCNSRFSGSQTPKKIGVPERAGHRSAKARDSGISTSATREV